MQVTDPPKPTAPQTSVYAPSNFPPPSGRLMRQYELVERVRAYDPNVNEDLLNRAYVFSMQAHGTQMRASGDPYFSHPLEVAGILFQVRTWWPAAQAILWTVAY